MSDAAANLGSLVGGVATVAAVLIAFCELKRWRRNRLDERRGDAAAAVLVTLTRSCRHLSGWCALLDGEAGCEESWPDPASTMRAAFQCYQSSIDKSVGQQINEMHDALVTSVALLAEEETRPLVDLQSTVELLTNELSGRFFRMEGMRNPDAIRQALADMRDSLGAHGRRFKDLEAKGKEILLPIAQLRSGAAEAER